MKIKLKCYTDFLFVVRLLRANTYNLKKLNEIIQSIDDSALNLQPTIDDIAKQFTQQETEEFNDSSAKLLKYALEEDIEPLIRLMDGYCLLSNLVVEGRERRERGIQQDLNTSTFTKQSAVIT